MNLFNFLQFLSFLWSEKVRIVILRLSGTVLVYFTHILQAFNPLKENLKVPFFPFPVKFDQFSDHLESDYFDLRGH